jgi:hypothetical protein
MRNCPTAMDTWEDQRARLSHDLLKNELVPLLSKSIRITEGRVKDFAFENSIPRKIEELAGRLCNGVSQISEAMVTDASPALFVGIPPLCELDEDSRSWLSEVVASVWMEEKDVELTRSRITRTLNNLQDDLSKLEDFFTMSQERKLASLEQLMKTVRELGNQLSLLRSILPYPI